MCRNCSGGVLNPNGIPHHSLGLARQGLPWVERRTAFNLNEVVQRGPLITRTSDRSCEEV